MPCLDVTMLTMLKSATDVQVFLGMANGTISGDFKVRRFLARTYMPLAVIFFYLLLIFPLLLIFLFC